MAATTIVTGNVVTSTCTFVPTGAVHTAIGTTTVRVIDPNGTATNLTPVADSTDVYTTTHTVGDTDPAGTWTIRWESSVPKISQEATFIVAPSAFGAVA